MMACQGLCVHDLSMALRLGLQQSMHASIPEVDRVDPEACHDPDTVYQGLNAAFHQLSPAALASKACLT